MGCNVTPSSRNLLEEVPLSKDFKEIVYKAVVLVKSLPV